MLFMAFISGCSSLHQSSPQHTQPTTSQQATDVNELKMTMLADMASIIFSDAELDPGIKTNIAGLAIDAMRKSSEIKISGSDKITRPIAVSFQKAFEQSLTNMVDESAITRATVIIHTRKPTTPLCNPPGKSLPETLHPSMADDSARRKTIEDRTITLRKMARNAHIDLYIAYTRDGLSQRSAQEQAIYRSETTNPENTSLHDARLACTTMPDEIVGASYTLTTHNGHTLYFGNNGVQAVDGTGDTLWRYWFGGLDDEPVDKRYREVMEYLQKCGLELQLQ